MATLRISSLRAGPPTRKVRVSSVRAVTTPLANKTIRVSSVGATVTPAATRTVRVASVVAAVTAANARKIRISRVSASVTSALALKPIADLVIEPFDLATVVVATSGGWVPDETTWRVISGPQVFATGSDLIRSFEAPATMDGATVVLGITATKGGVTTPEVQAKIVVYSHTFWLLGDEENWVAAPVSSIGTAGSTILPIGPASRNGITRPQTYAEDFARAAPVGAARTVYSDMEFYDGFNDTSSLGLYAPDKTISAHDSLLDVFMHIENGQPLVAAIMPDAYAPHLGGRWDIRYKTDAPVDGWKFVGMFWPSSDEWNDGEIDWPEADIGETARPASAIPGSYGTVSAGNMVFLPPTEQFASASTTDFHIYSTEWNYDATVSANNWLRFYFDGVLVAEITGKANLPTTPMRLTLQFETWINQGPVPTTSAGAHVYVDWIAVWGNAQ